MRLHSLEVNRLPGLDAPYAVTALSPHVTVVVGPNASGKSSLVRALRALLSAEVHAGQPVDVVGEFRQALPGGGEVSWRATRSGPTVSWERNGVPVEAPTQPPEHLLNSYLIAIETLVRGSHTDAAIGAQLKREMSGGYDLQAARQACVRPLAGHRRAAQALRRARNELADIEREQARLHAQLQLREELVARQAEAAAAAELAPVYARGQALLAHAAELDAARSELAAMPAVLERLTGRESDELAEAYRAMAAAEERRTAALAREAEARSALAATGLAQAEVDEAAAHALTAAAERLSELAERADHSERQEAELRATLIGPWRRLGGGPKGPSRLAFEANTLDDAETALGERMAALAQLDVARGEVAAAEAEVAAAEAEVAGGRSGHDGLADTDLEAARYALAAWLAAPLQAPAPRRAWGPLVLMLLALALLVAAGVVALGAVAPGTVAPGSLAQRAAAAGARLWLPAGAGLVAALAATIWFVATGRPATARRALGPEADMAREAYRRSGAAEPSEWSHDAVSRRLRELTQLQAARAAQANRQASGQRRLAAARRAEEAAAFRLEAAENGLAQLALSTGYGAAQAEGAGAPVGAGFAAWLRDVRLVNDVSERLRGVTAARRALEAQADALYAQLVAGLAGTPFAVGAVGTEPATWQGGAWRNSKLGQAAELLTATRRLARAVAERDRARAELQRAEAQVTEADAALASAAAKRTAVLTACELESEHEAAEAQVGALLAQRPTYLRLAGRVRELEALVRDATERLQAYPHVRDAALHGHAAALAAGEHEAERAAAEQHELSQQVGVIAGQVDAAERGREVEKARAKVESLQREVTDHLRVAQLNAATEVVLDDVEEEFRVKRQPRVLEQARSWFARFTHGAFELAFEPGEEPDQRLGARHVASGRLLSPAQLSTGTRAQLLLAFRVAHASCAEGDGARLPFFLDEALTTADAERFAQVAAALLELTRSDGRQVVYLSAREEDAGAWRRVAEEAGAGDLVTVLSLGTVRSMADVTSA